MPSLRQDDRGLTIAFIKLLGSLGVGAAVIWVVRETSTPLLSDAEAMAPGGMGAVEANGWFTTAVEILPAVFMLCAFFGFIVIAVYERGAA